MNKKEVVKWLKKNSFYIIAGAIILLGCVLRLYRITDYPVGLQQDEASIGYEAYAIGHYGMDRNGQTFPVHLIAWGSGQNALYAYLVAPFMMILSDEVLAIRLPMALIGCLTLILCFIFIKDQYKNKLGLLALFVIAVFPWHVAKSRWGLESQLFPDVFLYGLMALFYGVKNSKKWLMVLASVLFGISTYAYGPAYCFIPIFLVLTYVYLVWKKKIKLLPAVIYFGITGLVALPMILFVFINYFNLDTIHIFNITIPKLDYNRFTAMTSLGGNFIKTTLINLWRSLEVVYTQSDGYILNFIPNSGVFFSFALPFVIYGFVLSIKEFKKNLIYQLNLFYLIASVAVCGMVDPNITRINVIWFCLLIYLFIGLFNLCKKNAVFYWTMVGVYAFCTIMMVQYYLTEYQTRIGQSTFDSALDAMHDAAETTYNNMYVTEKIVQPYIYYLLATRTAPQDYLDTRVIPEKEVMFQFITSMGNIIYKLPEKLEPNNTYILDNTELEKYHADMCTVNRYKYYSVVTNCQEAKNEKN